MTQIIFPPFHLLNINVTNMLNLLTSTLYIMNQLFYAMSSFQRIN